MDDGCARSGDRRPNEKCSRWCAAPVRRLRVHQTQTGILCTVPSRIWRVLHSFVFVIFFGCFRRLFFAYLWLSAQVLHSWEQTRKNKIYKIYFPSPNGSNFPQTVVRTHSKILWLNFFRSGRSSHPFIHSPIHSVDARGLPGTVFIFFFDR